MATIILFSLDMSNGLIVTLIIGAVAGLLASYFTPGRGFGLIISIVLGLVGGYLGNMLLGNLLHITSSPLINQIICATIGAMILVVIINLFSSKEKKTDKSQWRA